MEVELERKDLTLGSHSFEFLGSPLQELVADLGNWGSCFIVAIQATPVLAGCWIFDRSYQNGQPGRPSRDDEAEYGQPLSVTESLEK